MRAAGIAVVFSVLALIGALAQSRSKFAGTLESHPAIEYRTAQPHDIVTSLRQDVTGGKTTLTFDGPQGYLRSALEKLDIPIDSQILLFSKTGIQNAHTSPEHPRALYFNDRAIVGYIPGAPLLEMASHDARQGVIFQTLVQSSAQTIFARSDRCLSCHLSANSLDVPGILVRSNFAAADGRAMPQLGSFLIDHRSPLEQRWGGWYVTGTHGLARHMGNAFVSDPSNPAAAIGHSTLNRTTLDPRVEGGLYPASTSDIVALMVFDHQGYAMNLLTRLGWETRIAAAEGSPEFTRGVLAEVLNETINYLLLRGEAKLPAPIRGVSSFTKTFSQRGPRDSHGRSLRDLDLEKRLFKYGCSYMIYSPAFDALPGEARAAVYAGMRKMLTDADTVAILDETKPDWKR